MRLKAKVPYSVLGRARVLESHPGSSAVTSSSRRCFYWWCLARGLRAGPLATLNGTSQSPGIVVLARGSAQAHGRQQVRQPFAHGRKGWIADNWKRWNQRRGVDTAQGPEKQATEPIQATDNGQQYWEGIGEFDGNAKQDGAHERRDERQAQTIREWNMLRRQPSDQSRASGPHDDAGQRRTERQGDDSKDDPQQADTQAKQCA